MKPRRENKRITKAERRRQRNRLISILTAGVVFFTTYAMVLPAVTMEGEVAAQEPGIEIAQPAPEPVAAEPAAEVIQEPAPLVVEPVAVEPVAEPVVSDQTVTETTDNQVQAAAPEAEAAPAPEAEEAGMTDAAQDAIVSSSSDVYVEEQETVVEIGRAHV